MTAVLPDSEKLTHVGNMSLATVVITTKNRKADLRKALTSAVTQSVPVEVIVVDDGSTDGTTEMVRSEFPEVHILRAEESRGYIVQRNVAAGLATTPYLFSIDDDAEFSSPDVVSQTIRDFISWQIAAVAIPCIDVHKSSEPRQPFPRDGRRYVTSEFIGTAYAVRRDLFHEIGGFRSELIHQGEERDFCTRVYGAGYYVALGTADPIHHYESPVRDTRRMDFYGRRNDVLYSFHHVPRIFFWGHLLVTTFNGLRTGVRARTLSRTLRGLAQGYLDGVRSLHLRSPVTPRHYRLLRRMRRAGYFPMEEIESRLSGNNGAVTENHPLQTSAIDA